MTFLLWDIDFTNMAELPEEAATYAENQRHFSLGEEAVARKKRRTLVNQRYYQKKLCAMKMLVEETWCHFPRYGLDRCKVDCLKDSNINYGFHQTSLGFNEIEEKCDFFVGTRSLGLRYENEHSVEYWGRKMCQYSERHIQFLQAIHRGIQMAFPKLRTVTERFMRVNLVAGAPTAEHTDTMRGATPNFMLAESHYFLLRVRLFPNFKDSVVRYKGYLYVPHKLKVTKLVMIGLDTPVAPWYFLFDSCALEQLEPFADLKDYIVVGIKDQKLQFLPWEYSIHETTATLGMKTTDEVLADALASPSVKPTRMFQFLGGKDRWYKFYGWRNAHRWLRGTDYNNRRIHVFYRPVREETASARIRTRKDTGEPINYTIVE